jgi:hypothetical protein
MVDHEETEKEILRLVGEADGRDRAMLLIIYRMHQELIANTAVTRQIANASEDHARILDQHAKDEMSLINQIRGGWRVATWAFAVVAALLGALQWFAMREIEAARAQIIVNTGRLYTIEQTDAILREQIFALQRRLYPNGSRE